MSRQRHLHERSDRISTIHRMRHVSRGTASGFSDHRSVTCQAVLKQYRRNQPASTGGWEWGSIAFLLGCGRPKALNLPKNVRMTHRQFGTARRPSWPTLTLTIKTSRKISAMYRKQDIQAYTSNAIRAKLRADGPTRHHPVCTGHAAISIAPTVDVFFQKRDHLLH